MTAMLWSQRHHGDIEGWILGLKCWDGRTLALQEGQAEEMRTLALPLSVTSQSTWCLVWDGWDDWELMGEDKATWPWRQRRWRHNLHSRKFLECAEDNFFSKWKMSQWGEVLCWTLVLPTRRGWWGFSTATMKCWNSRSKSVRSNTASSLPWTSDSVEQTLASSSICLVEYHGIKTWREDRPKKAG